MVQKLWKDLILNAIALMLIGVSYAYAVDHNTNETSSAKALGMGNAGINTERGPVAVFYNPASLAVKDTRAVFQLFNFSIDADEMWLAQSQKGGSINTTNFSKFYETVKASKGDLEGVRFSAYPNLTVRNFSLGLLYETNRGLMVRNSDSKLLVRARDRFGPTAGLSFRMFGGIIRFGMMAQLLTVTEANDYISPPSPGSASWDKNIKAGSGLAKSAGFTLSLPFRYLPSFSVVARDIGGTSFGGAPMVFTGNGKPNARKATYDLGTSFVYYLGKSIETKFEADYRDTTRKLGGSPMQHVFAGGEIDFFNLFQLRGGYMNAYPTAGFGLGTKNAGINISWYSDNFEDGLRAAREQRYVVQFSKSLFGGK